jgi:opacity protein-like surface antigen
VRRPAVARPPLRIGARPSRLVPYVGGGYSWLRYQETSDFSEEDDDVDDWFSGFHVLGGIEYRVRPHVAVGGEVKWSSIPDALGAAGASAAFGEDDLGGTTFRVKVSFGR